MQPLDPVPDIEWVAWYMGFRLYKNSYECRVIVHEEHRHSIDIGPEKVLERAAGDRGKSPGLPPEH